ncbi:MAG TPA: cbb3-type cytochrome c oxidase subunit 3 [Cyclobacteriaceae bacterium]|nr:cbb3-type cytochrome c oxidase subunit 3 [Cyclobacteriaceae bacterium]
MYKNVLQSIDNIAIWPVISFVIFFAFFLGLLLWVIFVDKKFIDYMKNMPIHDSEEKKSSTSISDSHVQS